MLLNKYHNTINIDTLSGLVSNKELAELDMDTLEKLKTTQQAT